MLQVRFVKDYRLGSTGGTGLGSSSAVFQLQKKRLLGKIAESSESFNLDFSKFLFDVSKLDRFILRYKADDKLEPVEVLDFKLQGNQFVYKVCDRSKYPEKIRTYAPDICK